MGKLVSLILTEELFAQLQAERREHGRSMSWTMRKALRDYFRKRRRAKT